MNSFCADRDCEFFPGPRETCPFCGAPPAPPDGTPLYASVLNEGGRSFLRLRWTCGAEDRAWIEYNRHLPTT